MARPGITYSEVANAAQQILASGKSPTIEAVRNLLGSGSNSTLAAHLKAWRSTQDQNNEISAKENIPEVLVSALKGVWEKMASLAQEKIQTVEQEAKQAIDATNEAMTQLQKNYHDLQQNYQQCKQDKDLLSHEKNVNDKLISDAKISIAGLNEKITGLELQHEEKLCRIQELHCQNQQVQSNLEHYRAASLEQRLADQQRYEEQLKNLEASLKQKNHEIAQAASLMEQVTHEKHLLQFEKDTLQKELNKLSELHQAMMQAHSATLNDLAKATLSEQHWKEQHACVAAEYHNQSKAHNDLQQHNAIILEQHKQLKAELTSYQDENRLLIQQKWELAQEKAQLYGQLKQLESFIPSQA